MKIQTILQAIMLAVLGASLSARADVVTDWNQQGLLAIKASGTPPPRASRNLAILHTAIYDAVNGINNKHTPYLVTGKAPGGTSEEAAAAAAGHKVLVALYPARAVDLGTAYATSLAAIKKGKAKDKGVVWGEYVAAQILASRANDGSTNVVPYTPGTDPGDWTNTPPAFANALLPQWPNVTPFCMTSGSQFRPPAPPAMDTAQWATEFNITKAYGSIGSVTRTAEQTDIARFWADGGGTVTPPGHWNVIAQDISAQEGLKLAENARLFALLNIATADAAICSWDAKYAYDFWRPITAIRNADLDGNAATEADPTWTPLLVTPPFPEYTSGHSTFSGAAATVLADYFGTDEIAFTTTSEDLPGVSRSFPSFSSAADEAGLSRIYGGIHFMSANFQGLHSGGNIGQHVMDNFLKKRHGKWPGHAK